MITLVLQYYSCITVLLYYTIVLQYTVAANYAPEVQGAPGERADRPKPGRGETDRIVLYLVSLI